MRLRISAQQARLRPALIALRKVEGFVYQREGGSFAVSLEPCDAFATAKLLYQLEQLGIEIKDRPKAVERAYERLLKSEPELLIGDGIDGDDEDVVTPPFDMASVSGVLVEHASTRSII
jgi:hypothetical protein